MISYAGIEYAMEPYLRGIPGELTVTIDSEGRVTEEITKEPAQGDTIVLTIDKDLQALAQKKLEETCKSVDYFDSTGAVVVENCTNGEVLAAASYPAYDLKDYYEKYMLPKEQAKAYHDGYIHIHDFDSFLEKNTYCSHLVAFHIDYFYI